MVDLPGNPVIPTARRRAGHLALRASLDASRKTRTIGHEGLHMLELTPDEHAYVVELLENDHKELLHELHHTATREFEDALKKRLLVNESVRRKLL